MKSDKATPVHSSPPTPHSHYHTHTHTSCIPTPHSSPHAPSLPHTHTSHPRLQLLQHRDDEKLANEQARNNLESHIFETKDTMYSDSVVAVSTEDQRGVILAALTEAGDWMEEEGYGAETKVNCSFNMFHTWSWSVLHMQENASCAYVAQCCWV